MSRKLQDRYASKHATTIPAGWDVVPANGNDKDASVGNMVLVKEGAPGMGYTGKLEIGNNTIDMGHFNSLEEGRMIVKGLVHRYEQLGKDARNA